MSAAVATVALCVDVQSVGDSLRLRPQKLSANANLLQIDADRIAAGISRATLAMAAGISCDTYQRRLRRPETVSSTLLIKLHGALRALVRNKAAPSPVLELTRWAYAGALERTARFYGVTPEQVAETSPQRGATADAHWRTCSHARQAAIYLVNTGAGVAQAKIAALIGVTPAAVCLALKDVEDRRAADIATQFSVWRHAYRSTAI